MCLVLLVLAHELESDIPIILTNLNIKLLYIIDPFKILLRSTSGKPVDTNAILLIKNNKQTRTKNTTPFLIYLFLLLHVNNLAIPAKVLMRFRFLEFNKT